MLFTDEQLNIIDFCAQECAHQESGELSVARMVRGWDYAYTCHELNRPISETFLGNLADMIEPETHGYYRSVPVVVRGTLIPWQTITRSIGNLIIASQDGVPTPEEFYKEFEEIHPFVDGNGRVGAILYNYLRGSLNNPIFPPNFWKDK